MRERLSKERAHLAAQQMRAIQQELGEGNSDHRPHMPPCEQVAKAIFRRNRKKWNRDGALHSFGFARDNVLRTPSS